MKLITYNIKLWKFGQLKHDSDYVFKTRAEANAYSIGLYNGMNLAGSELTGYEVKRKSV